MINFAMLKPLGGVLKRLDIERLMTEIQAVDVEKESAKTELGKLIIAEIVNKLEDISDNLILLCANYKGVTTEEMMSQNPIEVLKELFAEEGLSDFFKSAARLAGQK